MQEFDPIEHFQYSLRHWWLILAAALLGGVVGFLFSRMHPPMYEAVATFMVQVDVKYLTETENDLYYVDMALASTEGALVSNAVLDAVYLEIARLGQPAPGWELLPNTTIERRHAYWELRVRHPDPAFAQAVVNMWSARGYQAMLERQAQGLAPIYVVYSPPTLAPQPLQPVYFNTNRLLLAGSLAGWLMAILFVELRAMRLFSRPLP
jgi:uncharacterized protein involved in exopolysaccharide biosynthesis